MYQEIVKRYGMTEVSILKEPVNSFTTEKKPIGISYRDGFRVSMEEVLFGKPGNWYISIATSEEYLEKTGFSTDDEIARSRAVRLFNIYRNAVGKYGIQEQMTIWITGYSEQYNRFESENLEDIYLKIIEFVKLGREWVSGYRKIRDIPVILEPERIGGEMDIINSNICTEWNLLCI